MTSLKLRGKESGERDDMFTSIRTKRAMRVQSNHPSRKHRSGHICVRKTLRSSTLPQHIFEHAGVASIRGVRIFGGFYSSCAIENVELKFRCDSSDGWVHSQDKQIELTTCVMVSADLRLDS